MSFATFFYNIHSISPVLSTYSFRLEMILSQVLYHFEKILFINLKSILYKSNREILRPLPFISFRPKNIVKKSWTQAVFEKENGLSPLQFFNRFFFFFFQLPIFYKNLISYQIKANVNKCY